MRKIRLPIIFMLIIGAFLFVAQPVMAQPPTPSSFYGTVKWNGANVPAGTIVHAKINTVEYVSATVLTYNGDTVYSLDVPGEDPDVTGIQGGVPGDTVVFYIGSAPATQTASWQGGTNVNLNLTEVVPVLTITSAHGTVNRDKAAPYHYGDVVNLTAVADAGYAFTNWTGDVTSPPNPANPVAVTMNGNKSVTANYLQNEYMISGNAGVASATITYTGGSTASDGTGFYSFIVLSGWSGTVTPTKTGYTFNPTNRPYTNVMAPQTNQDYIATPVTQPPSDLVCTTIQPKPMTSSTGEKPQSKVWNYNGAWYAVFPTDTTGASSAGTWLWKLQGTNWTEVLRLSTATNTKADVKVVGNLAHILLYNDPSTQLASVQYTGGTYQLWSLRTTLTSINLPSSEVATIDIDSTGRLWLATRQDTPAPAKIVVFYSDSPYSTFQGPVEIASGVVTGDDISVVTALTGNKIGVLWSNQNTKRFGFRVHVDGASATTWSADELPASQSAIDNVGAGMADDHLNVKLASDGTLYAAVKTGYDTTGYPRMSLLVRRPTGVWDNLYGIDESGTRGNIELDEGRGVLTYIYTQTEGYNPIVYRQSNLSPISFGAKLTLRAESFNDVSSTKQNYNSELVIIYASATQVGGQICTAAPTSGADLAITKDDGKTAVRPGDPLTYAIHVTNNGPQAATGATVTDTFPTVLKTISWTCAGASGGTCGTPSGTGNINVLVNLPLNASATFTVSATVDTSASGTLTNTASITPPTGITDPITGNNTSTDTDTIITGGNTCETDVSLVGCWQMEEGSGSVLVDGSSFTNDASLLGSPAWATGKVGLYSLDLNGTSQYAAAPDDASLDLTNQITLATWIKPEQYATQDLVKKATNGVTDGYELSLATTKTDLTSQRAFFRINQVANGDTLRVNATTEYPINGSWMHVAATYDGATMRIYINGIQEASLATTAIINTNNLPLTIGAQDGTSASRWFMGWMDDVRVYKRALSAAEILQLASVTPVTYNISLLSGWNLVSFPWHPTSTTIANVLSSVSGKYDLVYAWDATGGHSSAGNWMRYAPGIPGNTLSTLDETQGFWIRMTSAATLSINGTAPTSTSISLLTTASGWNLVGYPSIQTRAMPGAFTSYGVTNYSLVYAYKASDTSDPWKRYANPVVPGNDLTSIVPNYGYWIKVGAASTWTVGY
jgi:uncharacterized repeat protein (TIGR01451 family)